MKRYNRNGVGSSCRISIDDYDSLFGFGIGEDNINANEKY